MKRNDHLAIVIALGGVGLCLVALVHFLLKVSNNNLPWHGESAAREHYLAVGQSYTQGFVVGFFLCFSLAVAAVLISSYFGRKRKARRALDQIETEA